MSGHFVSMDAFIEQLKIDLNSPFHRDFTAYSIFSIGESQSQNILFPLQNELFK